MSMNLYGLILSAVYHPYQVWVKDADIVVLTTIQETFLTLTMTFKPGTSKNVH